MAHSRLPVDRSLCHRLIANTAARYTCWRCGGDRRYPVTLTPPLEHREPRAEREWTCPNCGATLIPATIATRAAAIAEHMAQHLGDPND